MDRFEYLVDGRKLATTDEGVCAPGACILEKEHIGACLPPHAEDWKGKECDVNGEVASDQLGAVAE